MKHLASILMLLCSCSSMMSQGVLLKPMGTSYMEVSDFLMKQSIAKVDDRGQDGISAWTDNYTIRYHFKDQRLYKTEVVKKYADRKSVRQGLDNLKANCERRGEPVQIVSSDRENTSFAVLNAGVLYGVQQTALGKKEYQVQEVRINLENCSDQEKNFNLERMGF